jgi:predicted O-methyltransferase YrrM
MKISRNLRNLGKGSLHRVFEVGQRVGLDVLPRHFYSSIPDLATLKSSTEWRRPLSMVGVSGAGTDDQLKFVGECCTEPIRNRLAEGGIAAHAIHANGEPGFGPIEADFLYAFIASKRPKKVVQIGSGVSTAVILLAARESGIAIEIVCVEPYPNRFLDEAAREGTIRLIPEKAQLVSLDELLATGSGDLFFVDSTHTVQPGGEVNRIILEVLPRLAAGSYVHFHDIAFPYDYTRSLLNGDFFFPAESTLLHAFLVHNSRVSLAASLSMLHYQRPHDLRLLLPNYVPQANDDGLEVPGSVGHFPSSAYLRVAH